MRDVSLRKEHLVGLQHFHEEFQVVSAFQASGDLEVTGHYRDTITGRAALTCGMQEKYQRAFKKSINSQGADDAVRVSLHSNGG